MNLPLYIARLYLYWSFFLWTVLLAALTIARLSYTEHIPVGDPLNNGIYFYDPSVVALLVSSLLGLLFAPFMIYTLHNRFTHHYFTTLAFEVASLFLLWVLWLGSTAAATKVWPDLSFCVQYRACTNLQAMVAFAWLGWISLALLLIVTVYAASRHHAWQEHSHGPWADGHFIWPGNRRTASPDFDQASGPEMRVAGET